jgi:hypothetical protein
MKKRTIKKRKYQLKTPTELLLENFKARVELYHELLGESRRPKYLFDKSHSPESKSAMSKK